MLPLFSPRQCYNYTVIPIVPVGKAKEDRRIEHVDNYLFLRDEMTEFENYIRREYPKERGVLNDLSHDVMFSEGNGYARH